MNPHKCTYGLARVCCPLSWSISCNYATQNTNTFLLVSSKQAFVCSSQHKQINSAPSINRLTAHFVVRSRCPSLCEPPQAKHKFQSNIRRRRTAYTSAISCSLCPRGCLCGPVWTHSVCNIIPLAHTTKLRTQETTSPPLLRMRTYVCWRNASVRKRSERRTRASAYACVLFA